MLRQVKVLLALLGSATLASAEPWTLERAIQFALTNSPDARIAEQRIAAAQAGIAQANAAFWPQVQLHSSYIRTDNPLGVFSAALKQREFDFGLDFNHPPEADNLNVKGLVTVPLYAGGRNVAGRRAALASANAAKQSAEAIRNTLAFEVARAFFTVQKTREFIRSAAAAVRAYETNLSIVSRRFDEGTALKTDMLDVEVRLAQAREDLVRARNSTTLAERALRNLLGLEQGEFSVAEGARPITMPELQDAASRPELSAAEQRVRAAEAEVRRARAGYLPQLSAFASGDYDEGWEFRGSGRSWIAGAMAQWNIWDGQLTSAKVRSARADLEAAQEELRKLRLTIDLETEEARLHLKEAVERLAVTDKAVAQASESAELTRARLVQGLALSPQLIDAETALTAARVRRAQAEADQRIAIAALRKALGMPQLDTDSTR